MDDSIHLIEGPDLTGNVTSHHHQALLDGGNLEVIATAPDGVVEGIMDSDRRFYMGVQWHPEKMSGAAGDDLFHALVLACKHG